MRYSRFLLIFVILGLGFSTVYSFAAPADKPKSRRSQDGSDRTQYYKKWLDEDVTYIISDEERKVFKDLKTVIEFYNTRDVPVAGWGLPEVDHPNIFRESGYGNLGLTETEIDALVAFLEALTDGYTGSE